MKKFYAFLVIFFAAAIAAQAQPFTSQWKKLANATDYVWFNGTDNGVTSLDYNSVTDKLLVSKRNDRIFIINAATGAEEASLNTTTVGTESFKYNKIRVTSDGVIYAISLATGAGQCKIYRWANQAAIPTLCADFAVTERTGDAFGLSGTGINTVLYASGSGTTANAFNIYILNTTNGTDFFSESKVTMISSPTTNQQWANRTVEPAGTGVNSPIWIKGGGFNARKITVGANVGGVRSGTVVTTVTDGVGNGEASIGYGGMRLLNATNGNKYLGFGGGNNSNAGVRVKVLNVTNEAAITTYGIDSLYDPANYVANGNGSGDVDYKANLDGTYTVFQLSTNNGIQATKSDATILPVELVRFSAISKNKAALLNWTTASEANNVGFHIEKSLNGTDFSSIGFVKSKAVQGISGQQITYDFEDVRLTAKSFYRLKQVDQDGRFTYSTIAIVKVSISKQFVVSNLLNPIGDNIRLIVNSTTASTLQVQVTDAAGVTVISRQVRVSAGDTNVEIPATKLTPGMYYIVVKDQENKQVIQIIK